MSTKLKEGHVVTCVKFTKGNNKKGVIHVGDYRDDWIYEKFLSKDEYTHGKPSMDNNRGEREYLIFKIKEEHPHLSIANRMISYENRILAIELNDDGT
ncbi:hypothetical protein [Bacillus sp. NPDC094106]|uniref:hypothetical protein n=1 Tax=Bacillus sp. NPDC094106 TaxID=3363949 RepID=UPI0038164081